MIRVSQLSRVRTALAVAALVAGSLGAGILGHAAVAGAAGGATIYVQTMDSCHQINGSAEYALTGGGVSMSAVTPAGSGTASGGGCPVPTGSCSAGPCAVFSGVPDGTYRIVTTKTPPPNASNPEGYAPCEGGSACRSQVADLTVSGGTVSATVTNVYPDQKVTKFTFSGTSGDPIVFHDFGLAAPGSNGAQCDGDSDADDHSTGTPSADCAFTPESAEASACQPFPWSCTLGSAPAITPSSTRLTISAPAAVSAFTPAQITVAAVTGTTVDRAFTGVVRLSTSSDALATMPAAYTFTSADGGSHVFTVVFRHPGQQSLTASVKKSSGTSGATAQIPVANDDASFVEDLYHDILGRLGSDQEVGYWVHQMATGWSRYAVASFFANSPEVDGDEVDAAYQTLIGQAADPQGRAYWVSRLRSGSYTESLLASLASTSVYYGGHGKGTDSGFVTALYHDILGRAPSSAELQSWLSHGPLTDRAQIAADFAFSHEHHFDVVTNASTGWYLHYLGRPYDLSGAEWWAGQLDQGMHDQAGVADFTSGTEYYGKAATY